MVKVHQHMEATHMNSSEGEKVELKQAVRLEGVVEGWLCEVEDMMKMTLKDSLRACRVDLKKNLSKREKWVRDWPGQMLISASQIQWTADCEKALDRGDKKGLKSLRKKQVRTHHWSVVGKGRVVALLLCDVLVCVELDVGQILRSYPWKLDEIRASEACGVGYN